MNVTWKVKEKEEQRWTHVNVYMLTYPKMIHGDLIVGHEEAVHETHPGISSS